MATHSGILAWKIPWAEEPGRLQSMGSWRVRHNWVTSLSRIGEGNGNPLQCSCLGNPRDGGAWWAAVYGVAQSQTQLKRLSSSNSSMKVKVASEKVGLKLNIQKTKILASGPTTSWEIDGETVETVSDFIFLGSKITTDGDCSHEVKDAYSLEGKLWPT